ncbi:porin family protein [Spirosoma areae]
MKKTFIVLSTACLVGSVVQEGVAQEKPDYLSIEASVQEAYGHRDWRKVLQISKLAIDNRIDYLGLRQRAGIASFWRGDFRQSTRHLTIARQFDHRDSTSLEYLYYNLLYDRRPAEAAAQADELPSAQQRRLGIRPRQFITSLTVESGIKISSVPNQVGNAAYVTVGLAHRISPLVHVYQSVSRISQLFGNDLQLNQIQYYARSDLRVSPNWLISPSLHWFSVKGTGTTLTDLRQRGTVVHLDVTRSGNGWKLFPLLTYSQISNSMQAASTGEPSTTGGNPGSERQWQLGLGGEYAMHRVRFQGSYELQLKALSSIWSPLWNLNATFTASPTLSIRAGYGSYNTTNFLESATSIVNNAPDPTLNKSTLMVNWGVGKRTSLYVLGQYEQKRSSIMNQNYHYLTASGGFTIHF